MTFRHRLQYFLVKKLGCSNEEALKHIRSGAIQVNNLTITGNVVLKPTDTVRFRDNVLQEGKILEYVLFHKPVGVESTLNPAIRPNVLDYMPEGKAWFPVGRLDKASEGLMLLTNDGTVFDKILRKENEVSKKYVVTVDRPITSDFVTQMQTGVKILGRITAPAKVDLIDEETFEIVLTEGRNRQIRRMCHVQGYSVIRLVRTSIGVLNLGTLSAGVWRYLEVEEIETLWESLRMH